MAIVIQIGNTDNKLTQAEWASFITDVGSVLRNLGLTVHFRGGSAAEAAWQNYCWVADEPVTDALSLLSSLRALAQQYRQESIALIAGPVQFIES